MTPLIIFGAKYLIAGIVLAGAAAVALAGERRIRLMYVLAAALPLSYALARLAGLFYAHSQPFAVGGFEPLIPHEIDNSFPSDHVLLGGVFSSVAFLADRRFGLALWVFTLLVGLARMAGGLHYWVDVLAAAILAVFAVCIAYCVLKKPAPRVGTRQL